MAEFRFFRSARHPEFIEYEIKPVLVELELSTEFADTVAGLAEAAGYSVRAAAGLVKDWLADGWEPPLA